MLPLDPPASRRRPPSFTQQLRHWPLYTALAAVALAACGTKPQLTQATPTKPIALPPSLFRKWPKPDLALFLTGSMHGYLLPCGCSRPQVGGLERRFNLMQALKQRDWPILAADVGDVAQKKGPVNLPNVQGLIKYRYAMKAMKEIGYSAVSFGEHEAALPLERALGEWALNETKPRVVAANLKDADTKFPEETRPWELAQVQGVDIKVGFAGLVGPTVAAAIKEMKDPAVQFVDSTPALQAVLAEMDKQQVGLRVLLYQGSQTKSARPGFAAEAVECAKAFPAFQVVVCLNEEDEPSGEPIVIAHADGGKTTIVGLGHKGKNVGVIGVYRADKGFDLRYQLVEMSEDFLTPKESRAAHPIVQMMEDYTRELRDNNYLGKFAQVRHKLQVAVPDVEPTYVGSDRCKKCHEAAYEIWQKTPHAKAYATLAEDHFPANRQFDAECIVCHTVGFGYKSGFASADLTPKLKDVGCESCHGPASEHVSKPNDKQWQAFMNEWKPADEEDASAKKKRRDRIDTFCQTCHDIDNDVTWRDNAFERKWKVIAHPSQPE